MLIELHMGLGHPDTGRQLLLVGNADGRTAGTLPQFHAVAARGIRGLIAIETRPGRDHTHSLRSIPQDAKLQIVLAVSSEAAVHKTGGAGVG